MHGKSKSPLALSAASELGHSLALTYLVAGRTAWLCGSCRAYQRRRPGSALPSPLGALTFWVRETDGLAGAQAAYSDDELGESFTLHGEQLVERIGEGRQLSGALANDTCTAQIVKVGATDAKGLGVNELRNYIIGDQGSTVRITFKREESGEEYELDLVRGTPEYFDAMAGGPPIQYQMMAVQRSLYASGNRMQNLNRYMLGTSWSAEMFAQMPPPQQPMEYNPERALSEENEWLRNALRMAESTIMKSRTDLGSMREMFLQSKSESEARVKAMEDTNRGKDDERREAEQALLNAEEYRRTLEVKLAEAQRRSEWQRDTERQILDNERARVDYLNDIKRRAEEEKRMMEMELMRMQDDLRAERAARVEAEAREASLRSDFQRLTEHRGYDAATITSSLEVIPRPGQEALLPAQQGQGRTEIMMA